MYVWPFLFDMEMEVFAHALFLLLLLLHLLNFHFILPTFFPTNDLKVCGVESEKVERQQHTSPFAPPTFEFLWHVLLCRLICRVLLAGYLELGSMKARPDSFDEVR